MCDLERFGGQLDFYNYIKKVSMCIINLLNINFWVNILDLFRNEIMLIRFQMIYFMVVNVLCEIGGEQF